jgi:hypothetical protein
LGYHQPPESSHEDALFKTRQGAYFLYKWQDDRPYERIEPLTAVEAKSWMKAHARSELTNAEFGDIPGVVDPEARITLRVPESLRKRAAATAEENGQSLNAWILRCMDRCVLEEERGAMAVSLARHRAYQLLRKSSADVEDADDSENPFEDEPSGE